MNRVPPGDAKVGRCNGAGTGRGPHPGAPRVPSGAAPVPLAVLLLGAALAACGSDPADAIDRDTFIATIVELREADREIRADSLPDDSAEIVFAERRDEILERRGVTGEQLRRFVEREARDLERLSETWDTISERLKYVPGLREGEGVPGPGTDSVVPGGG